MNDGSAHPDPRSEPQRRVVLERSTDAVEQRGCWCGYPTLFEYSHEYHVCRNCGTLVSKAPAPGASQPADPDAGSLYSESYWFERQKHHHKLPDLHARSRLDLPERCTYWLQHLLRLKLPPGRVLELGCGHGGYLSLLNWAGFSAVGTEMSPTVVEFARKTFNVEVHCGKIEQLALQRESFDVVILNDVIEHLPRPLETLERCARLLSPSGFFVIQTPEYKEHLSYNDVVSSGDLFLKHMANNNEEHLYLFSRRSVQRLFAELGFATLAFANPVYSYDMYFAASRGPLAENAPDQIWNALSMRPEGRLIQALLDKAHESADRWWAIQRLSEAK